MSVGRFWRLYDRLGILFIIVLAGVFLTFAGWPNFLKATTLINILSQATFGAIGGLGMTFAIASGGFDLSVGSTYALAATVAASFIPSIGMVPAVLLALVVCVFIGLINGLIITKLRVPTFITTMAMLTVLKGITFVYTRDRQPVIIKEKAFQWFGGGHLLGIPTVIFWLAIIFAICYVVLFHTAFGRHVCAIGSNEHAAGISGLNVDRIKIMVFMITAVTAGLAGIMSASRLQLADANQGNGYELVAISVVILGGTSLAGGSANLWGTLFGAIFIFMVYYGLNLLGLQVYYQYLAVGLILIFALSFEGLRLRAARRARRTLATSTSAQA